jgi:tetratricopeptide (TPR) repeat protein
MNRGHAYYDAKNDYDSAIEDYTELIKHDLNNADYYLWRANSNKKKKDYDNAIADYTEAIRIKPDYISAYSMRGIMYEEKKDYDRAIADYRTIISIDPDNTDAYEKLSHVYNDMKKDYDHAITDYTELIKRNENNAAAYIYRANSYQEKKDYDRAIADYNEVIRMNPKCNYALIYRALAHFNKGDYDNTIADYSEVIDLKLDDDVVLNNQSNSCKIKDDNNAIKYYDPWAAVDLNYARVFNYRGDAYYRKGDIEKAIYDFKEALKLSPNNYNFLQDYIRIKKSTPEEITEADACVRKANEYLEKDECDRAIDEYTKAFFLNPNNAAACFYSSGLVYHFKKRDYNKAIDNFKTAAALAPDEEDYREYLERAKSAKERAK